MAAKILKIEDSLYSTLIFRRVLEACGYKVIEACSLIEGLA
jgi:hypothetical protein